MKVLIAPDKFKGTLSAREAASAMAEAVAAFNPAWDVVQVPMADGGEGTAELLTVACGGTMVKARASDPLLRQTACQFGLSPDGKTAFIDIATASGMASLQLSEANPMRTSTIGTGEMMVQAMGRGCKRIVLGLGGSATMDCGIGIAHALGVVFQAEGESRLSPIGGNLSRIEYIQKRHLRPELARMELLLLADVDCVLLGEQGAMQFATQKGLQPKDWATMEKGLHHVSNLLEAQFGISSKLPGMGAAGGAAMCCVAMLGGKLVPGASFVSESLGLPQAIADADLVLTGEGRLDVQSLQGKAMGEVARLALAQGRPVAGICGMVELGPADWQSLGLDTVESCYDQAPEEREMQLGARKALVEATTRVLARLAPRLQR